MLPYISSPTKSFKMDFTLEGQVLSQANTGPIRILMALITNKLTLKIYFSCKYLVLSYLVKENCQAGMLVSILPKVLFFFSFEIGLKSVTSHVTNLVLGLL